eukprot:GEMP01006382.1.p1 GENE.GEMP01006382.1~~GEMP01006382.1.p1  ORF type:complete len:537 (-),score=169.71 GEMP01006382.1:1492-3102(-)
MTFDATLEPAQSRHFIRALTTLNKVGNDVVFACSSDGLQIMAEGDANSAFLLFTFDAPFFTTLCCNEPFRVTLSLRNLCRMCNRSRFRPENLRMQIQADRVELVWKKDGCGIARHVFISIDDRGEHRNLSTGSYHVTLEGMLLLKVLHCFDQDSLSLKSSLKHRCLHFQQPNDGNSGREAAIQVDHNEFQDAVLPNDDSIEMIVSMRELKALSVFAVEFATSQNDFQIGQLKFSFSNVVGDPLRLDASFSDRFRATMLLSVRGIGAPANQLPPPSAGHEIEQSASSKRGVKKKRLVREASTVSAYLDKDFVPPWGPGSALGMPSTPQAENLRADQAGKRPRMSISSFPPTQPPPQQMEAKSPPSSNLHRIQTPTLTPTVFVPDDVDMMMAQDTSCQSQRQQQKEQFDQQQQLDVGKQQLQFEQQQQQQEKQQFDQQQQQVDVGQQQLQFDQQQLQEKQQQFNQQQPQEGRQRHMEQQQQHESTQERKRRLRITFSWLPVESDTEDEEEEEDDGEKLNQQLQPAVTVDNWLTLDKLW